MAKHHPIPVCFNLFLELIVSTCCRAFGGGGALGAPAPTLARRQCRCPVL